MDIITLTFTYTQDEYVKAGRQYLIAKKTIRRLDPVIVVIMLCLCVCYLFLSACSLLSVVLLAIALLVSLLGCFLYFWQPILTFKQTSKYHEEYQLEFSDTGIVFKTPSIDSKLQWSVYAEIWESDDFYFLLQAPRLYTLIPKRAFDSPAAMHAFEELASSSLQRVKRVV